LDLRLGFRRMRLPALTPAGPGFGGAQQRAFLRWAPPALARRGLGQGIELAGEQEPRDDLDRIREVAQKFLGSVTAVRQRSDRSPW
jgi:hypothetical protein